MYFCHQCERTVPITPSLSGDIICPTCNSGFVEEYQNPNPSSAIPDAFFPDPLSLILSQFFLPSANPNPVARSVPAGDAPLGADAFDPASYLFNLLANRRANGIDYQFVFEDHPSVSGFSLPANVGDYFVGPGFEQLIQQLAENDPNRYGTPPASKSAVEALPSINVDEDLMKSELAQCAVCKDDFELGTVVKQMPCKHVYHTDCILPWLELHNSCPVCRHELPTDDPDYESGDGSNDGDVAGESDGSSTVQRRFTVPLPWLFGAFGSGSGSDSGGEGPDQHRWE
ncbi:E3 ubiquitin-protein ligase ring1-like [Phtheirospermum japonicum]|uniref:RING-type E3 ubiquitin transferase n=1 Tax=Phtheirospermum japonicum TaxID=374723 RepID=A0A830C0W6_9LAMI|nr:E3 ubiquitin-protein ligase ring1-like [Phtheirospermum japonicum]